MTYSRILVPFDGSKYSRKALNEAIYIAKLTGGVIYMCMVINIGSIVPPGSLLGLVKSASKGELQKTLVRAARIEAEKLQSSQISYCKSKGVRAYYKTIVDGSIAEEILLIAKKKSINLIVIGSQGLHGLSKVKSLGSVSRRISELAPCPVMIVR